MITREVAQVLDKDLGLRLAYFLRAAGPAEIKEPNSPLAQHVFAVAGRELVVQGTDRVTGNYLLKLSQALRRYITEANYPEGFEQGVEAIAGPLREDLVRRLAVEQFWQEDGALD